MKHVMSLDALEPYIQILIYILIPFVVGLVFGFTYKKIRKVLPKRQDNASVIRAIVSEYTTRLDKYENVIAELSVRLDLMESRGQNHEITRPTPTKSKVTSGDISQAQSQPTMKKTPDDTSNAYEVQNGTTEYILRLLNERSMTSREVQQAIGRSREHSSRLMKKLHEHRFVSRDTNTKPFKYTLTEAGRLQLTEGHYVTRDVGT